MKVFKRLFIFLPLVLMFLVSCHGREGFYVGPTPSDKKPVPDDQITLDEEIELDRDRKAEVKPSFGLPIIETGREFRPPASHLIPLRIKQMDISEYDRVYSIAVDDADNIYMSGRIFGSNYLIGLLSSRDDEWNKIPRATSSHLTLYEDNTIYVTAVVLAAERLILIAKYNSIEGEPEWRKEHQIGWGTEVYVSDIAMARDGTIYVVGKTLIKISDAPVNYRRDAYLARITPNGELDNVIEIGAGGSNEESNAASVAVDRRGNVYVAGHTWADLDGEGPAPYGEKDFFLAKYASNGSPIWFKQGATAKDDYAYAVAVDRRGNAYVAGSTTGVMLGERDEGRTDKDAFIVKFASNDGEMIWKKQISTPGDDEAKAVVVDSEGNVFITGYVSGRLRGEYKGKKDIFVAKFTKDGREYIDQIGTEEDDIPTTMTLDKDEYIYIAGDTWGKFPGFAHRVSPDMFIIKYQTKP